MSTFSLTRTTFGVITAIIIWGVAGCAANLTYTPSSGFPSTIGQGKSLQLIIQDVRADKKICYTNAGVHLSLSRTPADIVAAALKKALSAKGFTILSSAPLVYVVRIHQFYVEWYTGVNVPVTGVISLAVDIQTLDRKLLAREKILQKTTEISYMGNLPAYFVAKRVMVNCLNQVVDQAVAKPTLMAALTGFETAGKPLGKPQPIVSDKEPKKELRKDLDFGKYYALLIGNNNYMSIPRLRSAQNDAMELSHLLKNEYGFHTKLLIDATRSAILNSLEFYRKTLTANDNLLIYYAGHGWIDVEGDEGYWLPIDATQESVVNWISNSSITTALKAMAAKHVLVIADSCYSGKLARAIQIRPRSSDHLVRLSQKRARSVLASGGIEPVMDSGGEGRHSIFAAAIIRVLKENTNIIDGNQLFSQIRREVMLNSDQTPEYADIRKAGHAGGDFLFVRHR